MSETRFFIRGTWTDGPGWYVCERTKCGPYDGVTTCPNQCNVLAFESRADADTWLRQANPTLTRYKAVFGAFPSNLTVRLSVPQVDRDASPALLRIGQPVALAYHAASERPNCAAYADPDPAAKTNCGECRTCWDPTDTPVYPVH